MRWDYGKKICGINPTKCKSCFGIYFYSLIVVIKSSMLWLSALSAWLLTVLICISSSVGIKACWTNINITLLIKKNYRPISFIPRIFSIIDVDNSSIPFFFHPPLHPPAPQQSIQSPSHVHSHLTLASATPPHPLLPTLPLRSVNRERLPPHTNTSSYATPLRVVWKGWVWCVHYPPYSSDLYKAEIPLSSTVHTTPSPLSASITRSFSYPTSFSSRFHAQYFSHRRKDKHRKDVMENQNRRGSGAATQRTVLFIMRLQGYMGYMHW